MPRKEVKAMAKNTAIQWCDGTVNPTMGCDGCELWSADNKTCYAGKLHEDKGQFNIGFSPRFEVLTYHRGRVAKAARWSDLRGCDRPTKPWLNGMPRTIFVSDMSDSLSKDVPFEYLWTEVVDNVSSVAGRRHVWMWLTKRPERMAEFARWLDDLGVPWPENLWAGTSITTAKSLSRIRSLVRVPARVRFLSVEPQLEDIDLGERLEGIHWVIQGGESGSEARRFDLEWADRMREQCRATGVAYFLKQLGNDPYENGEPIRVKGRHGGDWDQWPHERFRVREFPEG
jgi:protein gp37